METRVHTTFPRAQRMVHFRRTLEIHFWHLFSLIGSLLALFVSVNEASVLVGYHWENETILRHDRKANSDCFDEGRLDGGCLINAMRRRNHNDVIDLQHKCDLITRQHRPITLLQTYTVQLIKKAGVVDILVWCGLRLSIQYNQLSNYKSLHWIKTLWTIPARE